MMPTEGYVYHIKDEYFAAVSDPYLMSNKEMGHSRPTFLCIEDTIHPGLLWMVPMSSKVDKYRAIRDHQIAKHGQCSTILLGRFDDHDEAFLIQNLFPITAQYIDHIHTRQANPVPLNHNLALQIRRNVQRTLQLARRGKPVVFPDINRLQFLMLRELQLENTQRTPAESIDSKISAAQAEADRLNSALSADQPEHEPEI